MKLRLLVFLLFVVGCAHGPKQAGPWDLIKNDDAREKYIMVQQASGQLSYRNLYKNIDMLHKMYPDENIIAITRAGMYGDWGQTLTPEKEKEHKAQAVAWLQPFVDKKYDDPFSHDRVLALSQYYYHSGQYLKQYQFGQEIVASGKYGGEVLMAVGGSMHALELDKKGIHQEARKYAYSAHQSWEKIYDFNDPRFVKAAYQNSFYVSSLALLGECRQAQLVFDQNIKTAKRYANRARWLNQFEPNQTNFCKNNLPLTSQ